MARVYLFILIGILDCIQGGQILRMATALSSLTCRPVRIFNIRAGRRDPGLKAQHLSGLRLMRDICGGTLEGDEIGSTEVVFRPRSLRAGRYTASIKTAGSIALLLQVSLPCLIFANGQSQLILTGGTNVDMAPTIDYIISVLQPTLSLMDVQFSIEVQKRGFFPKGQGVVKVTVEPLPCQFLKPIRLVDRGDVTVVTGLSYVAGNLHPNCIRVITDSASKILRAFDENLPVNIDCQRLHPNEAFGNGCGIELVARTSTGCLLGSSSFGKRGTTDQQVGSFAATELVKNLQSAVCVDEHLQDQLIIFMALANGRSEMRCGSPTLHTQTAMEVARIFTEAKFDFEDDKNDARVGVLNCVGINFKALKQ